MKPWERDSPNDVSRLPNKRLDANIVVGVPGETEKDTEESIQNMLRNKNHFHILENIHTLSLAHGSEYYEHPEQHDIHFREDKKELYERHPEGIPPTHWYSVNSYIDQEVRVRRMKAIANALRSHGVLIGAYAQSNVIKTEKELGGFSK